MATASKKATPREELDAEVAKNLATVIEENGGIKLAPEAAKQADGALDKATPVIVASWKIHRDDVTAKKNVARTMASIARLVRTVANSRAWNANENKTVQAMYRVMWDRAYAEIPSDERNDAEWRRFKDACRQHLTRADKNGNSILREELEGYVKATLSADDLKNEATVNKAIRSEFVGAKIKVPSDLANDSDRAKTKNKGGKRQDEPKDTFDAAAVALGTVYDVAEAKPSLNLALHFALEAQTFAGLVHHLVSVGFKEDDAGGRAVAVSMNDQIQGLAAIASRYLDATETGSSSEWTADENTEALTFVDAALAASKAVRSSLK